MSGPTISETSEQLPQEEGGLPHGSPSWVHLTHGRPVGIERDALVFGRLRQEGARIGAKQQWLWWKEHDYVVVHSHSELRAGRLVIEMNWCRVASLGSSVGRSVLVTSWFPTASEIGLMNRSRSPVQGVFSLYSCPVHFLIYWSP